MAAFEFVLVLVSIIIGLAMTEVLKGVARVLRGDLRPYFLHSLWVVQIILHQLQVFWSYWNLNSYENFSFLQMLDLLVGPSLLFLAATILFPARGSNATLRDYYYSRRKALFGILALMAAYFLLSTLLAQGLNPATFVIRLAYVLALATLALTPKPLVHAVLTVGCVVGLCGFIAVFTPDLTTVVTKPT